MNSTQRATTTAAFAAIGLLLMGCPALGDDAPAEDSSSSDGSGDTMPPATSVTATSTGTPPGPGSSSSGPMPGTTSSGPDPDSSSDDGLKFDMGLPPDMGPPDACPTDPDVDDDMDGFTDNEGDCNDCDPNVNPGAIEVEVTEPDMMGVIPDPIDDDCDGLVDNVPGSCDAGLALASADPYDAAAAIGLCKQSAGVGDWGIVDAQYVRADGSVFNTPLQHGLMGSFGPNVPALEGDNLAVLSSGHARIPGQPNPCDTLTCTPSDQGTAPPGFPQDVPACPGLSTIFDDVALEVTLRAPTNATGYAYSFDFYSFEYPEWVCTSYNDQYIALVNPPPMGSINGNISFDAIANPVSVNIAFFDVCDGCPLGTAELQGTGFDVWDDAGATSWLRTSAPLDSGSLVTIRFSIWDTGDQAWDSTVLLDDFQWLTEPGVTVGTVPL